MCVSRVGRGVPRESEGVRGRPGPGINPMQQSTYAALPLRSPETAASASLAHALDGDAEVAPALVLEHRSKHDRFHLRKRERERAKRCRHHANSI